MGEALISRQSQITAQISKLLCVCVWWWGGEVVCTRNLSPYSYCHVLVTVQNRWLNHVLYMVVKWLEFFRELINPLTCIALFPDSLHNMTNIFSSVLIYRLINLSFLFCREESVQQWTCGCEMCKYRIVWAVKYWSLEWGVLNVEWGGVMIYSLYIAEIEVIQCCLSVCLHSTLHVTTHHSGNLSHNKAVATVFIINNFSIDSPMVSQTCLLPICRDVAHPHDQTLV